MFGRYIVPLFGITMLTLLVVTVSAADNATPPRQIPAFTAYAEPDPGGADFPESGAVTHWHGGNKIVWYGYFARVGALQAQVHGSLVAGDHSVLRLSVEPVAGRQKPQIRRASLTGSEKRRVADFGSVKITTAGYWRIALEKISGETLALDSLQLSGPAAQGSHFNLKPRRNAASVHLTYPTEKTEEVTVFYNEITPRADPLWTYYMACGWHRGYFGIQVNSPTERRIIFSVWDSGDEAVDRSKVAEEDRVRLLAKGKNVVASDFGNEGTGGHSHQIYAWKNNQTYRFCVTAKPDDNATIYSGYFYFPETQQWELIAHFRAPNDGSRLRGLYSFSENFVGDNGQKLRRAEFGNGWVQTANKAWHPLTTARFSYDATGRAKDRLDYAAGALPIGNFFLQNGGFRDNGVKPGDTFHRSDTHRKPPEIPDL